MKTTPASQGALALSLAFLLGLAHPLVSQDHSTSFETSKAGQFKELETAIGTWKSGVGKIVVDSKHAKTGKQCLQLTGGEKSSVILQIADSVQTTGDLDFWAERWTSRTPFSFRIAMDRGQGWEELYQGDQEVRVGRSFLNHVKVPLRDEKIKKLRFSCTSPPGTGILLDDLRFLPGKPQKITRVEVVPLALPALVGKEASPLLKLKIETTGQLKLLGLTDLHATLAGTTDRSDLESIQVRHSHDSASRWVNSKLMITLDPDQFEEKPIVFSSPDHVFQLVEGTNYLWIGGRLKRQANIDHRVGAACQQVKFSNGQTIKLAHEPSVQRMGVAVRKGGDDGVHTYRIPGLATTNAGTLIGVYDVRRRSGGDLPGDIDVGMSRSTDGGKTWAPMKVIMDMGDDPRWRYDGIGDPATLVDRNTGTIWVVATWSHGNRSWRGSGPGLTPEATGQLMLVRSDDDGVTWSKPINITRQVKKPQWCFLLQGPGKGITMQDGTIVFAAQYQDPPEKKRLPHSTILFSRDHGKTWQVGNGAFDDTTESQVVEIEPGVLMLNCRYNRKPVRVVMTTRDLGQTWQKHSTSERSLVEPGACMASLIHVDRESGKDGGNWLLFSNPDSLRGRHHVTIKGSPDAGLNWPKENRLLLDEETGGGYSCLSMIDAKTVGILYEGSQSHMTFQRIPLKDLLIGGESKQVRRPLQADGALRIPRVFGNHMVLQADAPLPVWGRARAGESVVVTFGDEIQKTTANPQGNWQVRLKPRQPSATPGTLTIESSGERVVFQDVLLGEVWLCAGQSNMQWTLEQSAEGANELAKADQPHLRLLHLAGGALGNPGRYTAQHVSRLTPQRFCEGAWSVASADTARSFSAVGWYFGRTLQQELKVPVGLICPAVGGTPAEAWIPREALQADPELKGLVVGNWLDNPRLGEFCRNRGQQNLVPAMQAGESIPGDALGPNHSFKPGFMWSAGIKPLVPYSIRGAIWYQGESNAETPARVREHGKLFPLLVQQWREAWGQGDFPFLFVQLPGLNRPQWPGFREGQRRILSGLNNLGMAITIDTGHPSNVHPREKKPVGQRLATWALGTTYQLKKHATYSGPLLKSCQRQGDSLVVSFDQVGSGLQTSDKKAPRHFEVCGKDGIFHPATAKINGNNTVSVSSPQVTEPTHARYAWSAYPDPPVNLFNSVGLPASPFSTRLDRPGP